MRRFNAYWPLATIPDVAPDRGVINGDRRTFLKGQRHQAPHGARHSGDEELITVRGSAAVAPTQHRASVGSLPPSLMRFSDVTPKGKNGQIFGQRGDIWPLIFSS
jgi:hypothetical protein